MKIIEENKINLPKLYRQSVMSSFYSNEFVSVNKKPERQIGSTVTHLGCLLELCLSSKINTLVIYSYKGMEDYLQRIIESNNITYSKRASNREFLLYPSLSSITFRGRFEFFGRGISCGLILILDYDTTFKNNTKVIDNLASIHCSKIIVEQTR